MYCNMSFFGQGIMNACCKEGIQMTLELDFKFSYLCSIATAVLVYFVTRKLSQFSIGNVLYSIIAMFILFCSKFLIGIWCFSVYKIYISFYGEFCRRSTYKEPHFYSYSPITCLIN